MSASREWVWVTRHRPCPICLKPDWCTVTASGTVCCCMRVESGRRARNGGWIHVLSAHRIHFQSRRLAVSKPSGSAELRRLAAHYHNRVKLRPLVELADRLGVSPAALMSLWIGWDHEAWTFPMCDSKGAIVGIRRRFADGRKLSVRGGREGLFIPSLFPEADPLLICEGPTDTAALLTLAFSVIGRPSCRGGARYVCEFVRGRPVAVVADRDEPGRCGAAALASLLVPVCPSVRVICPPEGMKDAREWVQAGATKDDILAAIAAAPVIRLSITTSIVARRPRRSGRRNT
jgi:hypothetical protein